MLACSEICFHVCINPSEVERIREVQRVSSCVWLTFVAVAFTCRLMFERFQTRSGCTKSQYPSDFFYISLSSGPWLNPCWGLVCLNLSGVNGHSGWWCRLCLRKKMNKNLPLTQTTESAQDYTWHSRWNASQICWNYFAFIHFGGEPMENILKGAAFSQKRKKNMLIVSITNEKDQSDFFSLPIKWVSSRPAVCTRGSIFRYRPLQGLHTTILTKALPRQAYGQNVKMSFPPRENPPVTLFVHFQMR